MSVESPAVHPLPAATGTRVWVSRRRVTEVAVFAASIAAAVLAWELVSRTGLIDQRDLPPASSALGELWHMMGTQDFWIAFARTVRGWFLGLLLATLLAVPLGIVIGASDFARAAFRVPIEFLRPIPSAALIPLLFLTLGTNIKSEVFLATFGAFWPILVQTMYGVRDVDPVATETARAFGIGKWETLYRITLPSSVPYIITGVRIASTVALILAFTAELFMGIPGLGQTLNVAQAYGLNDQLYALAVATGFLGLGIHLLMSAFEVRVLRWHASQRVGRAG